MCAIVPVIIPEKEVTRERVLGEIKSKWLFVNKTTKQFVVFDEYQIILFDFKNKKNITHNGVDFEFEEELFTWD